ncbi:alginate lyase family protein [Silvimonas amylolytica]|uniref:Alginate lyase domain-containing protein n=1 Tax=Silvimonas amylolytica TaxID=449663 RepID=A0ABQ2PIV7_9NEIS|nr:alginate lyase family protein [Silvimonas amylolytica]GGP24914.1 hypothetical protein GCM10010971_07330 [Silvimonas amylolytica]
MLKPLVLSLLFISAPITALASGYAIFTPLIVNRLPQSADNPTARQVLHAADLARHRDPQPMPRVHTEGTLPHQGIRDQSIAAEADWPAILNLALAWRLSNDDVYLVGLAAYLDAWFPLYHASFNPIDETNLDTVIMAYDLTAERLPDATRVNMEDFLRQLATGYIAQANSKLKKDHGNWQSHRIKLATMAAFALNDPTLIQAAHKVYQKHLANNLEADGSVFDFHERDALHYVVYDLQPLLMAALAAQRHDQNWYQDTTPDGATLAKALDWLTPYAQGEQTHIEYVRSTVKFDYQRRAAGEPGFSGPWEPQSATQLFNLAALVDNRYAPLAARLGRPAAWMVPGQ